MLWFRMLMENLQLDFALLYEGFRLPIAAIDCGERCAPHNERGVPFCCDLRHAVPSAYLAEWSYLSAAAKQHDDLWRPWQGRTPAETERLRSQTPEGQTLIACKGHLACRRDFRAITCRAFPFFPYLSLPGEFLGLSYYWEYEDRCWIISHLEAVTPEYRAEFVATFERIFAALPEEREAFRQHSIRMRRAFGRKRRAIPLLHRNGQAYRLTPRNGRLRRTSLESFSKFGPYRLAARLPFPDEV
jgi:hypothetical protein